MPSRKKSKPSFDVPQDVQNSGQAEWVYRSDATAGDRRATGGTTKTRSAAAEEIPVTRTESTASTENSQPVSHTQQRSNRTTGETRSSGSSRKSNNSSGILDLTARTFSAGFETLSNATLLGAQIALAPFRFGLRMMRLGR
jgi:hypothetical protein